MAERRRARLRLLAGASAAALAAGSAAAEEQPVIELDVITVTATRTGEPVYGALSPSSVWTRGELAPLQPSTVTDTLSLIPSVNTEVSPTNPATSVSVRGLQDFGRVNVMIDGARQNFQKSAHGANGSFLFDPEMLKSVDVTRGPSSAVYGSGAIGGVVSFTTLDADDVLDDGERLGATLKSTVESNAPAVMLHGELAGRFSDAFDAVVAGSWRDAGDYTAGGGETVNAGQELLSGLAKARFRPADASEITLSALHYDSAFDSALTDTVHNDAVSDTYTLGYRWTPDMAWADLSAKLYYTATDLATHDTTTDDREAINVGTVGFDLFNTSRFATGGIEHELTYGGDLFHDRVESRDPAGSTDDLTPSGERLVYGAFVQDKASYSDWLEVIGALRYDAYTLTGDGIDNRGDRLSPKLTVGVTPFEPVTLYATYAEGYRAPAITETLIHGFHPPPVSTGRFIPNPDLRPEVAHSIEGGVNLQFDDLVLADDRLRLKLGVFRNTVDDYIEQVYEPFPIPGGYQYQNVAEATIEGFEAEGYYDASVVFAGLSGQIMRGRNSRTGDELASVPPDKLSLVLGFRQLDGALEIGTRLTYTAKKEGAAGLGLVGDPWQTVDLFANWQINERTTAALFLGNLFDERYTVYPNGQPSPGFNAKASLTLKLGTGS